jgi:hypothetical protein
MRDSQPLLDALIGGQSSPVPAAIAEARRARRVRKRRRISMSIATLVAIGLISARLFSPLPSTPKPIADATPGLRIFTTGETTSRLVEFSSSMHTLSLARFSSAGQPLAIRKIDDNALLELLKPYGPAIVYLGTDRHPMLLLLNDPQSN